jgi:2-polyprenyl-3-methyl-5-hydroxy-6-metoxy-1,4-benzoquinol methylase
VAVIAARTNQKLCDTREFGSRPRAPSPLNVSVGDITRLLRRHIKRGDEVLEIGCAPGKYLLWCTKVAGAKASGVEYAPKSFEATKRLFEKSGDAIDLRLEDIFETTFRSNFNVVYSLGLIEHFEGEQLKQLVHKHVELLKPGGVAVIVIPNFRGWYGAILSRFNKPIYDAHNINLMTIDELLKVAPSGDLYSANAFSYGRITPWILSFGMPRNIFAKLAMYAINVAGLLQPFQINVLCPWLVLEIHLRGRQDGRPANLRV